MSIEKEKVCSSCCHLSEDKRPYPTAPHVFICDIINKVLSSSRILTFNLEWIGKFECNFYKEKSKDKK